MENASCNLERARSILLLIHVKMNGSSNFRRAVLIFMVVMLILCPILVAADLLPIAAPFETPVIAGMIAGVIVMGGTRLFNKMEELDTRRQNTLYIDGNAKLEMFKDISSKRFKFGYAITERHGLKQWMDNRGILYNGVHTCVCENHAIKYLEYNFNRDVRPIVFDVSFFCECGGIIMDDANLRETMKEEIEAFTSILRESSNGL